MLRDILFLLAYWSIWVVPAACFCLWEHLDCKHREKMVKAAQNLELEKGLTLLRAIQAYYGNNGCWGVSQGLVFVTTGGTTRPHEDMRVNLDTGEIMIYKQGCEGDKAEAAALVRAMIRTANIPAPW